MYVTLTSFFTVICIIISTNAFTLNTNVHHRSVATLNNNLSFPKPLTTLKNDLTQETPETTRERIAELISQNPVLLFMKGSKLFPQCGFSNTATQIINSYGIDFHTVDVLADEAIRQGIKDYSAWPTIPQLYVAGEFVGGSDIMIDLYQSGELGEMIEKAKADMI